MEELEELIREKPSLYCRIKLPQLTEAKIEEIQNTVDEIITADEALVQKYTEYCE